MARETLEMAVRKRKRKGPTSLTASDHLMDARTVDVVHGDKELMG